MVNFVQMSFDSAGLIERAAKVCTRKKTFTQKMREDLIKQEQSGQHIDLEACKRLLGVNEEEFVSKLVNAGHLSVGRHASATFEVTCSRSCSLQLIRHPMLSFCQESQRYVTFNKDGIKLDQEDFAKELVPYIFPPLIQMDETAMIWYKEALDYIETVYHNLITLGIPREDARYILPNACRTKLIISGNFQAWAEFCCLRAEKHAQWEIRYIAKEIFEILYKKCPAFFKPFKGETDTCKFKVFVDKERWRQFNEDYYEFLEWKAKQNTEKGSDSVDNTINVMKEESKGEQQLCVDSNN